MSYSGQRPSSSSGVAQQGQSHLAPNNNDQSGPQHQQSPLDWSNYTYLGNTPPGSAPAPSSQTGPFRQNSGPYGDTRQPDTYQNFNQGNGIPRPSPNPVSYGYSSGGGSQSYSQAQNKAHITTSQPIPGGGDQQGSSGGKGKSPANRPPSAHEQQQHGGSSTTADNGLSLDPAAFSRDIRFQVPQFLSNQMGGAPTFPPGGEAWSGFLGSGFGNDAQNSMGANLTPGSMFNNIFGLAATPDGNQYTGGSNETSENRNVLQGLSGFMDGDNGWSDWNMDAGKPDLSAAQPPATFYVNPNPSPNALSQQQRTGSATNQPQGRPQNIRVNSSANKGSKAGAGSGSAKTAASPRNSAFANPSATTSQMSASVPTSAILPPVDAFHNSLQRPDGLPYVPSMSAPTSSAHSINIASSSTAPYAPPSNTEQLLSGPSLPSSFGPSLSDGPGLYSTTGFDMVGVLARVANRKDPKTVLGPVDLSCSFVVVVSLLLHADWMFITDHVRTSDAMTRQSCMRAPHSCP